MTLKKSWVFQTFKFDALYIEVTVTEDVLMNCIKKLKSGKCPRTDEIINEYI